MASLLKYLTPCRWVLCPLRQLPSLAHTLYNPCALYWQDDPNAGYQHAGQAQQTTSPGGQTFTQRIVGPDGVALNVSIATAVLPGEMYEAFRDRLNMGQPGDGTLMFQMNDTGMMPFAA